MTTTVEASARAMAKPQRIAYLRDHGWHRISYRGAQSWLSPDPDGHRAWYTLAAAIREQLLRDHRAALPHIDGIPVVAHKREDTYGHDLSGQPVAHWVIDCPYCGEEHTHGAGPGHRVSHCRSRLGCGPGYFIERPAWDDAW
jgi:hypothetical protein